MTSAASDGRGRASDASRAARASGSSGSDRRDVRSPRRVDDERAEVGIGEVAIVHRLFLAPHRLRRPGLRIAETRLLDDRSRPARRGRRLPRDLVLERLLHVGDRVQVLDLHLRPESRAPGGPDRDVRVAPERPFLHVPVRGVHPADEPAESSRETRTASSGDRRSGSVTISTSGVPARFRSTSETFGREVVPRKLVHRLPGVLLEVDPVEADEPRRRPGADREAAPRRERPVELRDLVPLREVRVEVVLPREDRSLVNRPSRREDDAHRERHHFPVRSTGRTPGYPRQTGQTAVFGGGPEDDRTGAERLAPGPELAVHLQPDDGLEPGERHRESLANQPGRTFPGFRIPFGSRARLIARMAARKAASRRSGSSSREDDADAVLAGDGPAEADGLGVDRG